MVRFLVRGDPKNGLQIKRFLKRIPVKPPRAMEELNRPNQEIKDPEENPLDS